MTVRTSESEEGAAGASGAAEGAAGEGAGAGGGGAGGWHPQLAHLPQLPHPLRRRLQVSGRPTVP